ncbi:hypothetical protein HG536_0A02890 [Torulaspora globosa]|uniref:DNA 3'-phosphatase n=1 Tax=Torulaspora globosa TaxID=48254 RepID=A0A7G3ZAD6_9SACH|nr:uncharacterized protein HG536_0A02890 [Torulaspora globosa]QLL30472.1 hypothetical protein HG536_0A02890 [Torulaspora globosa]
MSHKLTVLPHLIKHTPKVHNPVKGPFNVYAFDLDHTLIEPTSPGARFSRTADDWRFMRFTPGKTTLEKLGDIIQEDPSAHIVIFSNQGGVVAVPPSSKSCTKYTTKIQLILDEISRSENGLNLLGRLWIYASPKRPASSVSVKSKGKIKQSVVRKNTRTKQLKLQNFYKLETEQTEVEDQFVKMRKPEIGMAEEFKKDLSASYESAPQITWCHYCGDAAGRPKDFSDSDKEFAEKLGVLFKLPEDVFI